MELIELGYGFLIGLSPGLIVLFLVALIVILGYTGAPLWLWTVSAAVVLWGSAAPVWLWAVFVPVALVFNVPPLRRSFVSAGIMKALTTLKLLPAISETERAAIAAGTVWVEGEFFSGRPDFHRMLRESYPDLSYAERAYLAGPVEAVCGMVDDWKVHRTRDLPQEVWDFLKEEKFFGLIIPEEYGGLGFSATAHSAIIAKLASRSVPLAVTVMVPNSLGPAELLIHYGTDEQKRYYLPRLADGIEIPCFALTETNAGSDAASIQAEGEIFEGDDGELYMRLNWHKRYITLAAISTILGLTFRLRDPGDLLGRGEDLGITCALIPSDTEGVRLGRRHDPLGVPFFNCPADGEDVVVSVDQIIGGIDGAGQGWRMLMESLAAGRGISLPAQCTGGGWLASRLVGAYAAVRRQFGLPIGRFEGIEEPLARIAGFTYLMDAARLYTSGAVDGGAKPAVVSAIVKHNFTELARRIANDGMDILGGKGISRGPRNVLASTYAAAPIGITVEGANILTRTLIIFGQGAIRCHPYAFREVTTLMNRDLAGFDRAFWSHIGFGWRNMFRSILLSITRGQLSPAPVRGPAAGYFRKLAWASASFAFLADVAMACYGGDLKRKGKITGRFADILTWMYMGAAVLRRYEAEGRRTEELPLVHWSMQHAFSQIQDGFDGIYRNIRVPGLTFLFRGPIALWSRMNPIGRPPADGLGAQVARLIMEPGEIRDRLTRGMFIPTGEHEAISLFEAALSSSVEAETIHRKLRDAIRSGRLQRMPQSRLISTALEQGVITTHEVERITKAEDLRSQVIRVDEFTLEEYAEATPTLPESAVRPAEQELPGDRD